MVSKELKKEGIETNCGAQILSTLPSVLNAHDHSVDLLLSHKILDQQTLALPLCENYDESVIEKVVEALQYILNP